MGNEVAVIEWEVIDWECFVTARDIGTKDIVYKSTKANPSEAQDWIDVTLAKFLEEGWSLRAVQPVLTGDDFEDTHFVKYYVERAKLVLVTEAKDMVEDKIELVTV